YKQGSLWLVPRAAPLRHGAARGLRPGLRAYGGVRHRPRQCARRDSLSAHARQRQVLMRIRLASGQDADALIEFNSAMALATEQRELLPEVISAGVRSMLANPAAGFYLVAEDERRVVGALMVTKEWSDWRNGSFWWIQSVYVRPECRRQGIYRRLYQHVKEIA